MQINLTPPELNQKQVARFWKFVDKSPGQGPQGECWEWIGARGKLQPYGRFTASDTLRSFRTNRLAFFLEYGIWSSVFILHACDNPPCCRPTHLHEGTQKTNIEEARERKRLIWGDDHWMRKHPECIRKGSDLHSAKLTEAIVLQIRERAARGENQSAMAQEFVVSRDMVYRIVKRLNWTHI